MTGYKTPAFVNTLKIELYQYLLSAIQDKIAALENNLAAIKESISNETKAWQEINMKRQEPCCILNREI
ncbi:MAG: hypothetical protein IPL12_20160 [Bacteroidetes bacterium]|nr:hypothetical protein [Bacteroidota bacterium]